MRSLRDQNPLLSSLSVILYVGVVLFFITAGPFSGIPNGVLGSSVLAETGEIDAHRAEILHMITVGDSLCDVGKYALADSICNTALSLSDSIYGGEDTLSARCIDCRVKALQELRKLEEAILLGERSLTIREKFFGPEHPHVSVSLNNLGNILKIQGDYGRARSHLERALAIRETVLGSEHPDVAASLNNLGVLLSDQGDYLGAEQFLERSLAIREELYGPEHPQVAKVLNSLGGLFFNKGDYAEAKVYFERALTIRKNTLGSEHPDVAASLNNVGYALQIQGDYSGAKHYYEQALEIYKKIWGVEHPDVALVLNNLGILLSDQGNYADAKLCFEQALSIWEKTLGPEHLDVAGCLNNLGTLLSDQGDFIGAQPYYERSLAIREKVWGSEHPMVAKALENLGIHFYDKGNYRRAKPLLERALEMREKILGTDHPEVAESLINLGGILFVQGDYVSAKPLWERALAIYEEAMGPDSPDVALSLGNLAALSYAQGNYEDSKLLLKSSLEIFEETLGSEHPYMALGFDNFAQLLHEQGDYEGAKEYYERALSIWDKVFGPEHPDVAIALSGLAQLQSDQGEYHEAKALMERALTIGEKALGPEHPDVALCIEGLSRFALLQGDAHTSWTRCCEAFLSRRRQLENIYAISSERQALLYAEKVRDVLDLVVSAAYALGGSQAPDSVRSFVVTAILQSKGQVLDEISARHQLGRRTADQEIAAVKDSLKAARLKIASLYAWGPGEEDLEAYLPRLKAAIMEKEKWELELASRSEDFREEQAERQATALTVTPYLTEGTVLVEFLRYGHFPARPGEMPARPEERDLAYVLSGGNATGPALIYLGSSSVTDSLIMAYRQHFEEIVEQGKLPSSAKEEEYRQVAGALYRRIWVPIKKELGEAEMVLVSPDASFNLVCFGGLPTPDGGYLIGRYPIQYLSSGRDIIRLQSDDRPGQGFLAFGDPDFNATAVARSGEVVVESAEILSPTAVTLRNTRSSCDRLDEIKAEPLPASGCEVRELGRLFAEQTGERVSMYLGVEALEDRLKAEARGKRVMHLATHSYYLQAECADASKHKVSKAFWAEDEVIGENPLLLAGLFLAGANLHGAGAGERNMDDGILTAEEICSLDLTGTEWVVLSACETGLGELKKGEGVFGLRRAFQLAGARTVIMSLWPVGDRPTRDYMLELYERRLSGATTVAAMREASLSQLRQLRQQSRSTHPFTWGAFVAVGDWR